MAVRTTMAALITRTRLLINDPAGASQVFDDQTVQDVLDESRQDIFNMPLVPQWTFSGTTPQVLDYVTDLGGWEDGYVLKQYLTVLVTPTTLEPIAGHWGFSSTTLPPVFITGKLYDVYRASADLLERLAARWMLRYDATADGQVLHRSQAMTLIEKRIHTLRMKQRPMAVAGRRSDLVAPGQAAVGLAPQEIDRMASG